MRLSSKNLSYNRKEPEEGQTIQHVNFFNKEVILGFQRKKSNRPCHRQDGRWFEQSQSHAMELTQQKAKRSWNSFKLIDFINLDTSRSIQKIHSKIHTRLKERQLIQMIQLLFKERKDKLLCIGLHKQIAANLLYQQETINSLMPLEYAFFTKLN